MYNRTRIIGNFSACLLIAAIASAAPHAREPLTEYIKATASLTKTLATVKDVDTAKAANPALLGGIARVNAAKARLKSTTPDQANPDDQTLVKEKMQEMQTVSGQLAAEIKRIQTMPNAYKELATTLAKLE